MKLLFALSQVELTGAETYATTLGRALRLRGHELVFVSDQLSSAGDLNFLPLPLHAKNTSYFGRWQNVRALKKILNDFDADLIHAHARAANLVAHFAKGRRPMVVTVHGRWRNHFAFRVLPALGEKTIAVCPALARYLTDDIKIAAHKIEMIPNGIDCGLFSPAQPKESETLQILFVGRFTSQKGNAVRFLLGKVLPPLFSEFKNLEFKIISSVPPEKDLEFMRKTNHKLGRAAIRFVENAGALPPHYQKADIIVGSGRVAMEALACGKPVVAIGESDAKGVVSAKTFEETFDDNFGDCGPWSLFLDKKELLIYSLKKLLLEKNYRQELGLWSREKALAFFDSGKIAAQVESLYQTLR